MHAGEDAREGEGDLGSWRGDGRGLDSLWHSDGAPTEEIGGGEAG